MNNAELIEALRYCVVHPYRPCVGCVLFGTDGCIDVLHGAAADALEAAEKKIAELERILKAVQENSGINFRLWKEAEARMNHKYCDVVNGCVMCDVELCNGKEKQNDTKRA